MDFELPEELAEVQRLAHDFAEKGIAPSAAQDDAKDLIEHSEAHQRAGRIVLPQGEPLSSGSLIYST